MAHSKFLAESSALLICMTFGTLDTVRFFEISRGIIFKQEDFLMVEENISQIAFPNI